jgi:hypothetical protein
VLTIALANAFVREDTVTGNAVLAAMSNGGSSAEAQRIGALSKYGYLRVPRRSSASAFAKTRGACVNDGVDPGARYNKPAIEVSCSPDPFQSRTTIHYTLSVDAPIRLAVCTLLGREVAVLKDGVERAGEHYAVFRASPELPAGTYMYILSSGEVRTSGFMHLTR